MSNESALLSCKECRFTSATFCASFKSAFLGRAQDAFAGHSYRATTKSLSPNDAFRRFIPPFLSPPPEPSSPFPSHSSVSLLSPKMPLPLCMAPSQLGKDSGLKDDMVNEMLGLNPLPKLPAFAANPAEQVASPPNMEFMHGTTTLAFKYNGGIVLAVDSRATGGSYIGSGSVRKLIPISKNLVGTMAGGAADCVYWLRFLAKECRLHELRNKEPMSVAAASKVLANICLHYKGMGLSMGCMIAGYDPKKGFGLYYVDSDGARHSGKRFSVGSGSIFAYGVLDRHYREDLTDEEAVELARRAIFHATFRDAASGGIIRVGRIKEQGFEMVDEQDCKELYYKYSNDPQLPSASTV